MIFASLVAKLGFDTSAWTAGAKKATGDVKNFELSTRGALSSIKSALGKGSELSQWTKILAGGGAIGGIVMVGKKIHDLADEWLGVTKAAEAAAQAQKDAVASANAAHAGTREGKKYIDQLDKQLRKANEAYAIATASPEEVGAIKMAAHNAELDDQFKAYKEKIDDLRDEAAQAQKEQAVYAQRVAEEQASLRAVKIGAGGEANVINAAEELAWGTHKQALADAEKLRDAADQKRVEASKKAMALEAESAEVARKIAEIKGADRLAAENERHLAESKAAEEELKAQKEAADQAVKIEKEKQRQIKEETIKSLEEQRDAMKANISKLSKENHASVDVQQIRGDAGIVLSQQIDPNTAILRESRDQLKKIEAAIKETKNPPTAEMPSIVNF